MSEFYRPAARSLQERFDTTALADRLEEAIVVDELREEDQRFVGGIDFFFLSTVSGDGFPTVSHKGGGPGLVAVLDARTLAFPSYDGNGMYLSMGNVVETAKVGLLFIDFERPARLRVQGVARVSEDRELLDRWPGCQLVVRVEIDRAWINCPRYIHRHARVAPSPSVPDRRGHAPLASWKRLDGFQDVISDEDRARVDEAGGPVSRARYVELLDDELGAELGADDST